MHGTGFHWETQSVLCFLSINSPQEWHLFMSPLMVPCDSCCQCSHESWAHDEPEQRLTKVQPSVYQNKIKEQENLNFFTI